MHLRNGGFLLIEVLMSVLFLGLISASFLSGTAYLLKNLGRMEENFFVRNKASEACMKFFSDIVSDKEKEKLLSEYGFSLSVYDVSEKFVVKFFEGEIKFYNDNRLVFAHPSCHIFAVKDEVK